MSMYAYWLANSGLTVHKLTGLMTEGIGAEELYALQESKMKKIRVLDEKDVEKITQSRRHWDVQEHWGKLQEEGIGFVCVEDARYPQKLRRISATPYALYYIGRLPEETRKSVAIVGARTRSAYGSQITGKLARALAQNRMDIISGMAMGIDADAHSVGLEVIGDTYAVVGCGGDVCYPLRIAGAGRHVVGISAGHTAAAGIFSAKKPYHSRTCGLRDCDGGKKKERIADYCGLCHGTRKGSVCPSRESYGCPERRNQPSDPAGRRHF